MKQIIMLFEGASIACFFIVMVGIAQYGGSVILRSWQPVDIFGSLFLSICTIVVIEKLKNK